MRHQPVLPPVQGRKVRLQPMGDVVGAQDGDLRRLLESLRPHHRDVHPRNRADARGSPRRRRHGPDRIFAPKVDHRVSRQERNQVLRDRKAIEAARQHDTAPVYLISDTGPDHDKRFFATVIVQGVAVGTGEGRSKKTAEQAAAEQAWLSLTNQSVGQEAP